MSWEIPWDDNVDVSYTLSHPIRTDEETVTIIAEFLAEWLTHTPHLQRVWFLFEISDGEMWWPMRDVEYISDALRPLAKTYGLDISVHKLPLVSRQARFG